jgi:hypothetical protein
MVSGEGVGVSEQADKNIAKAARTTNKTILGQRIRRICEGIIPLLFHPATEAIAGIHGHFTFYTKETQLTAA